MFRYLRLAALGLALLGGSARAEMPSSPVTSEASHPGWVYVGFSSNSQSEAQEVGKMLVASHQASEYTLVREVESDEGGQVVVWLVYIKWLV